MVLETEEGRSDGKVKIEERRDNDMLMAPEWDVDSFDGVEYYSSHDVFSSDEVLSSDELEGFRNYDIVKRQVIDSKTSNVEFVEVVRGNYRGGPRSKSYITFMAREKPNGPLVEYQAKCMVTMDGKMHPILCRPVPSPKP